MNPTVLVAEDDPVQRLLLRRALEPLGVEVRLARHGREALDLALEAPPHLVLTDLHMPHMDGLELTRRLKALDPLLPCSSSRRTGTTRPGLGAWRRGLTTS